eukprot:scaffold121758_cov63-Phaeocystis_antarctica.AAC.3
MPPHVHVHIGYMPCDLWPVYNCTVGRAIYRPAPVRNSPTRAPSAADRRTMRPASQGATMG